MQLLTVPENSTAGVAEHPTLPDEGKHWHTVRAYPGKVAHLGKPLAEEWEAKAEIQTMYDELLVQLGIIPETGHWKARAELAESGDTGVSVMGHSLITYSCGGTSDDECDHTAAHVVVDSLTAAKPAPFEPPPFDCGNPTHDHAEDVAQIMEALTALAIMRALLGI